MKRWKTTLFLSKSNKSKNKRKPVSKRIGTKKITSNTDRYVKINDSKVVRFKKLFSTYWF